jgi:hypothetical protein
MAPSKEKSKGKKGKKLKFNDPDKPKSKPK